MFTDLKVLVVGDLIIDHYIYGSVNRISPEAPVPILDVEKEEYRLGGAGNTLLNVRGLGVEADVYGWAHFDARSMVWEDYEVGYEHNLKQNLIKTRLISNQQLLRYDIQPQIINPQLVPELGTDYDLYILSDYNKGVIHQECLNLFKNKNTFLGLKPSSKLDIRGIPHVVLNRKELFELTGLPFKPNVAGVVDSYLKCAIDAYFKINPDSDLLVTLSENGMAYCNNKEQITLIPATTNNPVDVTGAGDTVLAAYALAYQKMTPIEAARFANCCAGIVIQKQGTTAIQLSDVSLEGA